MNRLRTCRCWRPSDYVDGSERRTEFKLGGLEKLTDQEEIGKFAFRALKHRWRELVKENEPEL